MKLSDDRTRLYAGEFWRTQEAYDEDVKAMARELLAARPLVVALMGVRAKAKFEMDNPTGLERTCLSLIYKEADKALANYNKATEEEDEAE